MKKLLIGAALVAGAFIPAPAQDMSFGVKGGINLSDVTNVAHATMKPGFHLGGYAAIAFSDKLAFQPELLLSTKGYKFKFTLLGITTEGTENLSYIELPLLIKFSPIEMLHVSAGPYAGILAGRKAKTKTSGGLVSATGTDTKRDGFRGLDLGAALGAGVQLESGLNIGARYSIGFTSIHDSGTSSSTTSSSTNNSSSTHANSVIQLYAGFSFGGR